MKVSIQQILHFFPEVKPPILVSDEQLKDFQDENVPFPIAFVEEVLKTWEKGVDEFTEFIPCFSLPKEENFYTIVYWRGGLLKYEYILVTLDKNANLISRRSIASTIFENKIIKKSAANIETDLTIQIMAGQSDLQGIYDASQSAIFHVEILPSGEIILED